MGVISSLLGVGGIASNLLTNSRNQSNNDRNYDLALRQQQFAEDSFKKQMHFNSPVTQAALMRAAGTNPALVGSGLAGSVSTGSSGGLPSNNVMQPLDLGGLNGLSSNIALLNSQKEKNEADAKNTNVLTETKLMQRDAELEKILADKDLSQASREYYQASRDSIRKLLNYQDERSEWENHNLRLEAINKTLQNESLTLQNYYLPMMSNAQIKSLVSSAYLNYMSGKMQGASTEKIKQETISELIRSGILGNDFYKGAPEGLKGKTLYETMKKHPNFRKLETSLDLFFDRLNSLPISFGLKLK